MKHLFLMLAAVLSLRGATAQELTKPRFQGADAQRYKTRLVGEMEKLIVPDSCPLECISPLVRLRCTIDTAGRLSITRFLDRTGEGRDYRDNDPVTPETQEFVLRASERLEAWVPARRADGTPASHIMTLSIRLPIDRIAKKRELTQGNSLLFNGVEAHKAFHNWAKIRLQCDEGLTVVRFFIEPDGSVTIDEVVEAATKRNAKEVVRVIRHSKGKWTPHRVNGQPVRSPFEYRINTHISRD